MHLETTKIIDRYLAGELSAPERTAFEEQLKASESLRNEVDLQYNIQEAAIRASFRADVHHAARRYKLNRIIKWGTAGLGVVAVIVSTTLWISSSTKKHDDKDIAPTIALSMMEQLSPNADFEPLPIQYFSVPKAGDVFLSDQSVMLSIPEKAFLLNNKVYTGEAIVQFQEAIKANEIVKAGLNTMSGDGLLETQGMFSIHAYTPDGTKLEINPKVGVYVQIPVEEHKSGMKVYDYVQLKDGTSDWQNPRGLSKIPVPIDMKDLNFYPEGYEAELDQLKWKRQKSKRDSLYLSFEDYCEEVEIKSIAQAPTAHTAAQNKTADESRKPLITKTMVVPFPAIDASYPGGGAAMKKFINKNLNYPVSAIKKGVNGRVFVDFEVDEYGFISNEKVVRSLEGSLDAEALRIIRAMPRWLPAETNGQNVRTRVRIPIDFALTDVKEKESVRESNGNGFELMLRPTDKKEIAEEITVEETLPLEMEIIPQDYASGQPLADSSEVEDTPCNFPHVSPSKVLAFWKPEFNNTNLSTREFERRMKAIHATCDDAVLKQYTTQLSKPISEIDRGVVNMGYSDFGLFAKEQVGAVNPNNPHLENIKAFYEKGVNSLQQQAEKDKNWEQQLRNKWDQHLTDLRSAHSISTKKQAEKSTKDEVAYNQKRTVQKLGLNNQRRMNPVAAYPQFGKTIGFTARRSGGYNCDRAVSRVTTYQAAIRAVKSPEALENCKIERINVDVDVANGTETRETFSVTTNGKTRTIAYNSLSFGVSNPEKYDRIIAYAFPHQLESYQLLKGENGNFITSLNDDMIYDICIVGISDEGYSYFQKQSLKGGSLGLIDLEKITESKLDASILQMNSKRTTQPASMDLDLTWIKAEKKNFKEINRRKDMKEFRQKIVEVIYPCYDAKQAEGDISGGEINPFGI